MARIYSFSKEACAPEFRLRSAALSNLNKKNLLEVAKENISASINDEGMGDVKELGFPIVEDSLLYVFSKTEQVYAISGATYTSVHALNDIVQDIFPSLILIKNMGENYLTSNGHNTKTTDSLYAAAVMYFAIADETINETHKAIMGNESAQILKKKFEIRKNPLQYHASDTPPESKLLHKIMILQEVEDILLRQETEMEQDDLDDMIELCEHITQIDTENEHCALTQRLRKMNDNLSHLIKNKPMKASLEPDL